MSSEIIVNTSMLFEKLEVRNIAAFAHEPTKYPKSSKQITHSTLKSVEG